MRVNAAGNRIQADGRRFFRIPFRRGRAHGQIGNIHAQCIGDQRAQLQDTGVIHATAKVQHRRNAQRPAQALQPRPRHGSALGHQQPGLARRCGDAACGQNHNIFFDKRLHEAHVGRIVLDLGIVAANHAHKPTHRASLDGIQQRIKRTAQSLKDGLVGETGHDADRFGGDFHTLGVALHKGVHRHADDLAGFFPCIFGMEIKMDGPGKAGLGCCVDKTGVVAASHLHKARHDALVVHHHNFHSAGHDCQLRHQVVACHGDALPHEQLITGTAQPGNSDACCSVLFGKLNHFRVASCVQNHLGHHRIVPVHQNVDCVLFDYAKVGGGHFGLGCTEKHVAQFCGDHGTSPTVGQGATRRMQHGIGRIIIAAHVGAVHHFGNFAVNAARSDVELFPQLAALGRNTREKIDRLAPAAKIAVAGIHHIGGHIKGIAPFCCHAQLGSNTPQFGLVPNLVAGGAAFHYCLQSLDHITSVIGVPSRAASDKTAKVAGHNHIGVCATHAARKFSTRFGLGTDAARPHDAVAAGGAKLAKTAMRRLLIQSVPGCFYAICSGLCQHTFGIIPYGHVVDVALLAFHSCPTKLEVTRRAKSAPPSLSYWYHSQARASVRCATMEQ